MAMKRQTPFDERGRDATSASRADVSAAVEVLELACECGRSDCRETISVSLPTLGWARSRGLTLLRPGHETTDDTVLERTREFLLVRSFGD
jgi:hypothetical protein